VNRGDAATVEATWAAGGRWHVGQRTMAGRPEIMAFWKEIMAPYESRIVQVVGQGQVQTAHDDVVGRWTFLEFARKSGRDTDHVEVGCYADRYIQENGEWCFAERRIAIGYRNQITPGDFCGFPR